MATRHDEPTLATLAARIAELERTNAQLLDAVSAHSARCWRRVGTSWRRLPSWRPLLALSLLLALLAPIQAGRAAGTTAPFWNLAGNGGADPSTSFLGTTDNQPLVIRTNNTEALRVTSTGNVDRYQQPQREAHGQRVDF